jgi:hypothetical protein
MALLRYPVPGYPVPATSDEMCVFCTFARRARPSFWKKKSILVSNPWVPRASTCGLAVILELVFEGSGHGHYGQDYCTLPFYLTVYFCCIDASGFYATRKPGCSYTSVCFLSGIGSRVPFNRPSAHPRSTAHLWRLWVMGILTYH